MPHLDVDGSSLYYRELGNGEETVVMSHSFLVDHRQFEVQIEALAPHYRVVAFDHRDHGRSASSPSSYGLDTLVEDASSLIEALVAGPCHFVGHSTGGFVGMRLAVERPRRFSSLVLMDTSAGSEVFRRRLEYGVLLAVVRAVGVRPLSGIVMRKMFGSGFRGDPDRRGEARLWRERMAGLERDRVVRFARAIFARGDFTARLAEIDVPTLVLVGSEDRPTPPREARRIAEGISGAELVTVPDAGHLSTIERPERVTEALSSFWKL